MGGKPLETPHFLKQWRLARGLTQEEFARRAHIGRAAISKIEAGKKPLMQGRLQAFADALEITVPQLYEDPRPGGAIPMSDVQPVDNTQQKVAPQNRHGLRSSTGERPELRPAAGATPVLSEQENLPVYGYVAGVGDDEVFFIDQGHEMTRTVRPNVLKNVRDAYAVDVAGDSMSPRFEPGNRLWVRPKGPVRAGDDVVIQLDGERAIVKRLIRKTEKFIIVAQFNPTKEIKIPKDEVRQIDLVVGMLTVAT